MDEERKLILDTETTGLSFEDDKIIEIGIVELKDNVLTQNYFHEYINPEKNISLSAQKIHGISNDFLINKPKFSNIAQKFLDFVKDDIIIIHNAEFDTNFINKELLDCGFSNINNSIIDTIKIAKKQFPGQTVNLDALCRKLNITNSRQNYHGALLDATLLSKVYLRLTTGKQEDLNLMDIKSVKLDKDNLSLNYKDNFRVPRAQLMNLSDNEKNKHERFLDEMTDSIWKKIS
tara:strand:- start:314 stop:1012 length:699 start_codon:yes stop_codon:yes gene_type:complete